MRFALTTPVPPSGAAAVTPSDVTTFEPSQIYVGGAGNVTVKPAAGGAVVLFTAPPVGSILPVLAVQVMATGTTATAMVRMF